MKTRPARATDIPLLLDLRAEAAAAIAATGNTSGQWVEPWPDEASMVNELAADVAAARVAMFEDRAVPAATITLSLTGNPGLWTAAELDEPAVYFSRFIVRPPWWHRGWGAEILDWAGTAAARAGCRWLRADAWTTNTELHGWYARHGCTLLRVAPGQRPSSALIVRAAGEAVTPRLPAPPPPRP